MERRYSCQKPRVEKGPKGADAWGKGGVILGLTAAATP